MGPWQELWDAFWRILTTGGRWATELAVGAVEDIQWYGRTVRWAWWRFLVLALCLLIAIVLGAKLGWVWLVSPSVAILALVTAGFIVWISPLAGLVARARHLPQVGPWLEDTLRIARLALGIPLWCLLFLFFATALPLDLTPAVLFIEVLGSLILALMWAVYGIGVDPRRARASVILVMVIAAITAIPGIRPALARCTADPSRCFERQPARFQVVSEPADADVYVNWQYLGRTPVAAPASAGGGTIVVVKQGYRPEWRTLSMPPADTLSVPLAPDRGPDAHRILIAGGDDAPSAAAARDLAAAVAAAGRPVVDAAGSQEYQIALRAAGGAGPALFAWTRARFLVDYVCTLSVTSSSQDLGRSDVGYEGVRGALRGMYRTNVALDVRLVDARSGDLRLALSPGGQESGADASASRARLTSRLVAEAARQVTEALQ